MPLTPGMRLGVYEVVAAIGQGGMGDVYRARDTKLDRDVAIKILPEAFAHDPERVARFQREAKTLAALNHPNIGGIYGVEETAGAMALVLELVEGPTLADRIAHGPIPVSETLPIARQIAEALEAAHEHGIIHRDLKPANIKVREDGTVKVLDFGLAKVLEPAAAGGAVGSPGLITQSPTLSIAATQAGVILGTAAYMSPEQAKGKPADKRSDIWAFGCVLYEMLTGKRAFRGDDLTEILAGVVLREPDWTLLPSTVPAAIRTLLRRCLEKDRRKRIAEVSTALVLIDEAPSLARLAEPGWADTERHEPAETPRRGHTAGAAAMALVVGGAIAGAAVWWTLRPAPPPVVRLAIAPTGPEVPTIGANDRDIAITPDGTRVIYVGNNGTQLFVRPLGRLETMVLTSGSPRGLFVSPDGQWVGFADGTTALNKIALTGGPAVPVGGLDGAPRGATWPQADTIVFATNNPRTGLQRVPAAGGDPTVLTRPEQGRGEIGHWWPEALPEGRGVLFTIMTAGGLDAAQIAVFDFTTGTQKIVMRGGSHARYLPTGHLVYAAGGTLRAVRFDLDRLETQGTPVPAVPRLVTFATGAADFDVAGNGTLVYYDAPGAVSSATRTLVWVDRQGREQPVPVPPRVYVYPRVSPDGRRIVVFAADEEQDLWLADLPRQTLTRLTFDPATDTYPVWSPDGRRIMFFSARAGGGVFWQAADGTGRAEPLTAITTLPAPTGVSPDGMQLVVNQFGGKERSDVMSVLLTGNHEVRPLVQTSFNERNGIVSPDGQWLAYESDSSGRFEIYVRRFSDPASGQWQVSTGGGTRPLWARNGKELFYLGLDGALMRVPVEAAGPAWNAGMPTRILESRYLGTGSFPGRTYDISPDGQRFLMIKPTGDETAAQIVVVQNWHEELKRLVPTN